jgi:hypothetical protein
MDWMDFDPRIVYIVFGTNATGFVLWAGGILPLYAFYDAFALIHDCMGAWLKLGDFVTARHKQSVILDEVFMAEDICYVYFHKRLLKFAE